MSVAEGTPPTIFLPGDPGFREHRAQDQRSGQLRRDAIVAAALAHAAVIVAVIVHWPALFPAVPLERPPIPVTLVTVAPPPPPAPKPATKAVPTPPPAPAHELVSGPDTTTTAPPQAAEKGAEAAPQPTAPPAAETPNKTATAESKPAPEAHPPKPKTATRETAPKENHGFANRAPGDQVRSGDPYLNEIFSMIERHRRYPANAVGSLGLRLDGTSVYIIAVRADGTLVGTRLERSSGAPVLDDTALKMIQEAAPFPPPPRYFPSISGVTEFEVTIHLFPGAG